MVTPTPEIVSSDPKPPLQPNLVGAVALILALVGLGLAFVAPVALLAWLLILAAFILAIVGWARKNRRKAAAVGGIVISSVAFVLSIVVFSVYTAGVPAQDAASQSGISAQHTTASKSTHHHSQAKTPSPTPLPLVPDASSTNLTADSTAITNAGYAVQFVDTTGASVTQLTGYVFVSQSPTPGTSLQAGATITITVKPTPPPAPKPAPAPAPKPAPKPAPPVHAAPPAPVGPLVVPGAFCPDSEKGVVGHSAEGKTYTCGGHGPDASGHLHWNTD